MKRIYFYSFILISLTLAVISSCNENTVKEDLTIAKGLDYYPMEIGKYIIYEVDSIIYRSQSGGDCLFARDSSHFYLKEQVIDTSVDNTGDIIYILERYIKYDLNDPWQVTDVWSTTLGESQVERVEENLRFIKMVFPVKDGIRWNGNTFFSDTTLTLGGEVIEFYKHWSPDYEYVNVDFPEVINNLEFDSVVTVVQSEPSENKVNYRSSVEKYARNVGLIYKEMSILDTQCCLHKPDLGPCDTIPWEDKAERGLIYRQSIIEHN